MSITTIAGSEEIKKITFPGQQGNEQIILIKRRHPIILAELAAMVIFLLLVPFFTYLFLPLAWEMQITEIFQKLFLFIASLYYLFICLMSFFIIIDYYLDVWIITDQRIIAIEQKGLFRRTITEIRYGRIQDITSDVIGLVPTFFRFGNIRIQTAAEDERIILKQITHPVETRRIIADLYQKATEAAGEKKQIL